MTKILIAIAAFSLLILFPLYACVIMGARADEQMGLYERGMQDDGE